MVKHRENKDIKILCLYGNTVFYGHERSNMQVFALLKDEGFNLKVLTNKKGVAPEAARIMEDKSIPHEAIIFPVWDDMRKPIKITGILRYIGKVIRHNFAFYGKLSKFKPDYIYIANDFMYMSLVLSFLFTNTKVVYRLGDAPVMGWKPFRILWQKYIVKRTYRFVCISEYIRKKLIAAGRPATKDDIVIYNYPPIRAKKVYQELSYVKKGLTFSYLGQLIDIKGVGLFIDAAITICTKYNDVYFTLAGDLNYSKAFTDGLIAKVNASGYAERITFLGSVENIADFFKKSDVLLTPSLKEEPLGNVLVEAKTNNTPSIIFNSGGMPELIAHKKNGYVCKESTARCLVEAMEYYIENRGLIELHGKNAYESISQLGIGFEEYRNKWVSFFNN